MPWRKHSKYLVLIVTVVVMVATITAVLYATKRHKVRNPHYDSTTDTLDVWYFDACPGYPRGVYTYGYYPVGYDVKNGPPPREEQIPAEGM